MCRVKETLNEIMKVDCDRVSFYNKNVLTQCYGNIANFIEVEFPNANWMELANESDELSDKYIVLDCGNALVIKIVIVK